MKAKPHKKKKSRPFTPSRPPEATGAPAPPLVAPPVRIPIYDPGLFWRLDPRELVADGAFILFGILLSRQVFHEWRLITAVQPVTLLGLYLAVVILVPWYMGFILARFDAGYGERIQKAIRWIFGFAGVAMLAYLLVIAMRIVPKGPARSGGLGEHFAMFGLFMLVIGPFFGIGGYLSGQSRIAGEESSGGEGFLGAMIAMIVAIFTLVFLSMSPQAQNTKGVIQFLVFIVIYCVLSPVSGMIALGVLLGIRKLLVFIGVYEKMISIFEIVFPFFIVSALIMWSEVNLHFLGGSLMAQGVSRPMAVLASLVLTGLLPFRIALMFTPPLRAVNIAIGAVAFLFFLASFSR